ncbi:MAG: tetratricopeptide repeat protein [Pseudomonadota bacterium]|nr:tetratricopeptide repeat protein [Pseudomonadota bacterium]
MSADPLDPAPLDPALLERIEGLEEIVADDPDDHTARFMLATELAKAGRHLQAIPHFEQVITADPDYTAAYRGLGRALVAEGDTDAARAVFERGVIVADRTGDYQSGKEMEVFLRRYTQGA